MIEHLYQLDLFVSEMSANLLVGQITGPIVQIVIQAPNLARMFFGGYWSNLPDGPLENPRWRPCFQDGRHFHYSNLLFKIKCICLVDFSDLNIIIYILAPSRFIEVHLGSALFVSEPVSSFCFHFPCFELDRLLTWDY